MKVLPLAVLVILTVTVGAAGADISLEWRRVTADSGTLESEHAADEVLRPDPGSARSPVHPRWAGHPRNERVIPKSRDFH